jgi:hypothetical protein
MGKEIEEFTNKIGATSPQKGEENYKLFQSVFRRSNYFIHSKGFLIIKISRSEKPFWGVGKTYIDFLNELEANYFLVLLESERSGYVFSKNEINDKIKRKEWKLAGDDNFKINSPLHNRFLFRTTDQFLSKIGVNEV